MNRVNLAFALVLVLSQYVYCSDSGNILLQGRFNLNHPPSVEHYNPLPDVTAYDDAAVPTGKSVSNSEDYSFEKELTPKRFEESVLTDTNQPHTTIVTEPHNKRNDVTVKPKGRALNKQQIPVAVIYETEDKLQSNVKPKQADQLQADQHQFISNGPTNRQQKQLLFRDRESRKSGKPVEVNEAKTNVQTSSHEATPYNQRRNRERDHVVPILESENYVYSYRGNYHYSYESGDGTKAYGKGELRTFSDNSTGEAVEGNFSYTDKDGNDFSLTYTADENGYRPLGAHLPTPPPLPPAIERALRYLATKTTPEPVTQKL